MSNHSNTEGAKIDLTPRIAVIGVGGAGGNAVNNMIAAGLEGVTFIVANTDAQALAASEAEHKLQLGVTLTEGLGAGSKPEIGAAAAEEAADAIRAQIDGCHMVFVAAGMGGGTGTGAAGVIARIANEMQVLTVGVVTKPFHFEGQRRMRSAEAGIAELAKHVDTLIAIPNQNLFRIANEKTTFAQAFELADQVLHAGISCVTDLIVREGLINLDFADVKAIMLDMGAAMMGTGEADGDNRAVEAAELAIANPLLDDVTLKGARGLLVSISGSEDLTLFEVDQAANRIRKEVDPEANIIVGANFDPELKDRIRVSIVASGLRSSAATMPDRTASAVPESKPVVHSPSAASTPKTIPLAAPRPVPVNKVQPAAPQSPRQPQQRQAATQPQLGTAQLPPKLPVTKPVKTEANAAPTTSGVRIEVGPPTMLAAGALSRPVDQDRIQSRADADPVSQAAFLPQAPSSVRRSPPRLPEIDEFPPVAKYENHKKNDKKDTHAKPSRRSRLFERLKGGASQSDDYDITDLGAIAQAIDSSSQATEKNEQTSEIPGFFKRQMRG